jgi:hypothetical protein
VTARLAAERHAAFGSTYDDRAMAFVPDPEATGHDTPEAAALADFDPRFARVVRTTVTGERATVELATNEPPTEYPYWVRCVRINGRWYETGCDVGEPRQEIPLLETQM